MTRWNVANLWDRPKDADRGTEDGSLSVSSCYAVLDGVTSKIDPKASVPRIGGLTPGQFARDNGVFAMQEAASNYTTPVAFVQHLTQSLRQACAKARATQGDIGHPGYTFAAFLPEHGVVIRVGDCRVMLDGVLHTSEMAIDVEKAEIRRRVLQICLDCGVSVGELLASDPTMALMDHLAARQQICANNSDYPKYGYPVVNGKDVPEQFIWSCEVPADVQQILLASDGLPTCVLSHDRQETERLFWKKSQQDPLCIGELLGVRGFRPDGGNYDDIRGLWLEAA